MDEESVKAGEDYVRNQLAGVLGMSPIPSTQEDYTAEDEKIALRIAEIIIDLPAGETWEFSVEDRIVDGSGRDLASFNSGQHQYMARLKQEVARLKEVASNRKVTKYTF